MVVNAAQLATYSQAKQFILGTGHIKVKIINISSRLPITPFMKMIGQKKSL